MAPQNSKEVLVLKIHIVKKGDTLYELANKYHVELDQIIALNSQLADPNQLSIGEKVKIPSKPKPVEPPASDFVYKHVVQQGDSLWKLGKAWDIPLQAMIQANPQLKNPNVLMTGEVVYIPKAHGGHEPGHELGQEYTQVHQPGHMTHHSMPLPGHQNKKSTAPFVQEPVIQQPVAQPTAPLQTFHEPSMPIVEEPISEAQPSPTENAVPEMPSWNMPSAVSPVVQVPEAEHVGLDEPYTPAVHPFQQFHITATEVFAYPSAEQAEIPNYPEFSPYQQSPWEQGYYPMETGPLPVSNGGCGCGETNYAEQPWQTFPAGMPSYSGEEPWQGYPSGMPAAPSFAGEEPWQSFPQGAPSMPGFYPQVPVPMGSPYDMQQMPCYPISPEHYAPKHGMMPHYGMPYPTPYESPLLPQVHTHQLAEETDTEETVEIDIRSGKKGEKAAQSKKARVSSDTSSINAFLKRQQYQVEKSSPKPNLPWINV
jgi:LysM repeat protein